LPKGADMRVLLLGATGTIGRATAAALLAAGHEVIALVRAPVDFSCPTVIADVTQDGTVARAMQGQRFDAVISCLASRTGAPRDAWAIDHRANSMALTAAQAAGVKQFVLLSAICVQKPLLDFQRAKLAFEGELQSSGLTYSIVRPTAFFKSLSGQVARAAAGRPFLVFGNGKLTACKPISDGDLARYLAGCLTDPAQQNCILPIGGPGPAITPLDQAAMLEEMLGRPVRIKNVPIALMNTIITVVSALGRISPKLAEKANLARIGRYYGTESMLLWDGQAYRAADTPEFGQDTLRDHYAALLRGDAHSDLGAHGVF
jgi:divinyl chlorophyllide a 8-vinyl-reductase